MASNLKDAIVENAMILHVHIENLTGQPKPPTLLRSDYEGGLLKGHDAEIFFLQPEEVKIVLDKPISEEVLAAYHMYISGCKACHQWPEGIIYIGSMPKDGKTILSFQALQSKDVIQNLSILLRPFRFSDAIDWTKTDAPIYENQLARIDNSLPQMKSLIEKLQQFEGFADAKPERIITKEKTININLNADMAAALSLEGKPLLLQLYFDGDNKIVMEGKRNIDLH